MNLALALKVAEVIGLILGTLAFALLTYWKAKERALTKNKGLEANPERCEKHENSINDINMKLVGIGKDIQNIKDDIAEIKGRLP